MECVKKIRAPARCKVQRAPAPENHAVPRKIRVRARRQREGGARFPPGFPVHARAETQAPRQVPAGFRQVSARSPPGPRQVPARFLPGFRQVPRQVSHLAACQVACQVPCQAPQEPPARCPARFPSDSDHAQLPPSGIGISIWLSINMSIKTITSGPSMWITGMALTTPTFGSYHGSYTFP